MVSALTDFAARNDLPREAVQAADLALEEHLTNVWNHGYDSPGPHDAVVRLWVTPGWFVVEVEDDGKPFNPLDLPEVDTSIPLEQKPIGGLGVHLIRRFMDEVQYRYERGRNILRMKKRFGTASP